MKNTRVYYIGNGDTSGIEIRDLGKGKRGSGKQDTSFGILKYHPRFVWESAIFIV